MAHANAAKISTHSRNWKVLRWKYRERCVFFFGNNRAYTDTEIAAEEIDCVFLRTNLRIDRRFFCGTGTDKRGKMYFFENSEYKKRILSKKEEYYFLMYYGKMP